MTLSQHTRATELASRANDDHKRMFTQLGSTAAPNGKLLQAYRVAKRSLTGKTTSRAAVLDALAVLRRSVLATVTDTLSAAQDAGIKHAEETAAIYTFPVARAKDRDTDLQLAAATIAAQLDAQLVTVRALALTGSDEALILGDDQRSGILTAGPIILLGVRWLVELSQGAFQETTIMAGDVYHKQAVAALDERTTDCCIRVHGQTQPLNKPFRLTGTPRYADELDDPPFHDFCRTAEALVLAEDADDSLTKSMIAAAKKFRS